MEEISKGPKEEQEEEVKWFTCCLCDLKEVYDTKSTKPKFTPYVSFSEGSYLRKDPFSSSEKKQFFLLGSDCCVCKNPVCQSPDCSIFYKQRYCQSCAAKNRTIFPGELHSKIKK